MTTKNFLPFFAVVFLVGCYLPNDPPKSEFAFAFPGRLERLEDAFYASKFDYKERDFLQHLQQSPEYEFTIVRADTVINYVLRLGDCQSIYSLVKWNENLPCDSSNIIIRKFSSNIDSLPASVAEAVFKQEIIDPMIEKFNAIKNTYRLVMEKKNDTVLVKILNQEDSLRKLYIYSFDPVGDDIAEKQIINYLGDSTIIYHKSPEQRYVYLKRKEVIYK